MDTPDLVAEVLHVLTQGVDGAASAAGGMAAQALLGALRERLRGTEDDRAALDAFVGNPGDAAGRAAVRAILEREVAADPAFGRRLAALADAAAGPPPQSITGSVVVGGGARVHRNQISLGPLTVNNNRQGRWLLAVLAVALMILVALAGYGGARVFTDGDEDASPGTSDHGASDHATPDHGASKPPAADPLPATRETADAILPDRAALAGTSFESLPGAAFPDGERGGYEGTVCGEHPEPCGKRVRAGAVAGYAPDETSEETGWHAEIQVLVHASEDDAEKTFDALADAFRNDASSGFRPDPSAYTPPDGTRLGDELTGYRAVWEGQDIGIMCMMRRGPYVALVAQEKDGPGAVLDNDTQTGLNTLLLRRMDEALSGAAPHAALRDVRST
ncbi:hypothetical protein ACUJ8N_16215 [Streptomyces sp. ESR1.13]|uniref:hypothetical protein n=1 Tax=unclassified Streptomyces TaxID=2593676 RepID=UPI00068E640D|nr:MULTISPECIES: hypothetical protein [unclassified Streptomyces]